MLSYKNWKKINESVVGPTVLGLGNQNKVGDLQSKWDEMGANCFPMKSKKMFGGDDMGDMPPPPMKKKKPMPPMPDEAPEGDMGGDEAPDDDMGDDGDEAPDDDDMDNDDDGGDDAPDDELGGDDVGDDAGGDVPPPPMKKKKPGLSSMPPAMPPKMMKKESAFMKSLKAQTGGTKFVRDQDGDFVAVKEDAIIPPANPNAGIEEPKPGDVGYAPTGRVGSIGSFAEWTQKYKK